MPPNEQQQRLADLTIGNVLAVAPAGCGKTEALAERARAVLQREEVRPPRKILALSFSNKAKDNLARRMRLTVGSGWRQRIWVTNFHGLAGRVIRAHGAVIGTDPAVIFPEEPWRREARQRLGISWANRNVETFENALRYAKAGPFDDEEVMGRLEEYGIEKAISYEGLLREEGRLDHDDMLRHGARLLAIDAVGRLYRAHFGLTMVDEVQDLSVMQYEMVRAVGGDTVTYAGDPAQGIYTFAVPTQQACSPTSGCLTRKLLSSTSRIARHQRSSAPSTHSPRSWGPPSCSAQHQIAGRMKGA